MAHPSGCGLSYNKKDKFTGLTLFIYTMCKGLAFTQNTTPPLMPSTLPFADAA